MEDWIQKVRENRTLPRSGTSVAKDIEQESEGYTTSDSCPRNNTHKVKKLVKGNRYWNLDNGVGENCSPTHFWNPPKASWGLRKLVTGPQGYKSTVKTVCYIIRKQQQ